MLLAENNGLGMIEIPLTPQEVKKRLPLEWLIGDSWGIWGVGSRKVACPNPEHKDDTPSFNLWSPDDKGLFTKFGCYGCGIKGDAIDVIKQHYGVDFHEALRIAEQDLIPKYESSDYNPKQYYSSSMSPEDIEEAYEELVSSGFGDVPYISFLANRGILPVLSFGREQWAWMGHSSISAVSFPHYNTDGKLTGVKFRDSAHTDRRWGIRGSRYPHLYGAWRDSGHQNLILCEGETDTVFASWQLRDRQCDVLGLPTGATQHPTTEYLEQVRNRTVWLAFDGDKAGRDATKIWMDLLPDAKVVVIPDGRDICNCDQTMVQLLGLREQHA